MIKPVSFSEWAVPTVPVLKSNGSLHICGDYKVTFSEMALPDRYPFTKMDDLFAMLAAGETFTKLDIAHAYQQLVLDKDSSKLIMVNAPQGLFE